MRCLYWGRGHLVYVTKVITHMATRCLCLLEGKVDIMFNRQSASKLDICNWPANQPCDKISTFQALGWSDGGRRTGSPTTLGPSPGSQHSHWFPLGSDLPDQGQAIDTNELCSPLYTIGTIVRDCLHLITYSCMKCREMLHVT